MYLQPLFLAYNGMSRKAASCPAVLFTSISVSGGKWNHAVMGDTYEENAP
jgi:hypothetical protein